MQNNFINDYKNFHEFYEKELKPVLIPYEKKRKFLASMLFKLPLIIILPLFIIIFVIDILTRSSNTIAQFVVLLLGLISFMWIWISQILFYRTFKNEILTKIFNKIGFNYISSKNNTYREYVYNNIYNICNNAILYKSLAEQIFVDDLLLGKFNNNDITIADICMGGKNSYYTIWGIYVSTKIDKKFSGQTIVKAKELIKIADTINIKDKFIVKTESTEFNDKFNIYTTDQVEARYILTTAFIERLLKYQESNSDSKINIVFDNNLVEGNNIFILINTGKDYFEIDKETSLLYENKYSNLIFELNKIFEILNALKLDNNTGL